MKSHTSPNGQHQSAASDATTRRRMCFERTLIEQLERHFPEREARDAFIAYAVKNYLRMFAASPRSAAKAILRYQERIKSSPYRRGDRKRLFAMRMVRLPDDLWAQWRSSLGKHSTSEWFAIALEWGLEYYELCAEDRTVAKQIDRRSNRDVVGFLGPGGATIVKAMPAPG